MMKKFLASTLCLATMVCSFSAVTVKVDAASQFWGDKFGNGFDYHNSSTMEFLT